jgi:hypothetical protein
MSSSSTTGVTAHLPPATQFPTLPVRQPIIPDDINDVVDRPRKRAVSLMNRFRKSAVIRKEP